MEASIFFNLAIGVIIASGVLFLFLRENKAINTVYIMIAGVFVSGVLVFIPLYCAEYSGEKYIFIVSFFYAVINSMQMFFLNSSYHELIGNANGDINGNIRLYYEYVLAALHFLAPVLTGTVILSLVGDTLKFVKCRLFLTKDKYIFSEINRRSLALADSVAKEKKNSLIIFVGSMDGINTDLTDTAKQNGYLILKGPITSLYGEIRFHFCQYHFFCAGENQTENLYTSTRLIEKHRKNKSVFVYSLTDNRNAESILDTNNYRLNIRIINEARTAAYELLNEKPVCNSFNRTDRQHSVLIFGLGNTGLEILKAMIWCCTFNEHKVSFTVCDKNILAAEGAFRRACPSIDIDKFDICFHPKDMDITLNDAFEFLEGNGKSFDYIVISTGNDDNNIDLALDMKVYFSQNNTKPHIHAIIRDEQKFEIVRKHLLRDGDDSIYLFGCYKELFTYNIIVDQAIQKIAMAINLVYLGLENGDIHTDTSITKARTEWNKLPFVLQRSNMALALHLKYRLWEQGCEYALTGETAERADYLQEILNNDDKLIEKYAKLEHERWNKYMLTEGWLPFEDDEEIENNKHRLPEAKKHAAITSWERLIELDKRMPAKKFILYDINFIKATDYILSGLDGKLGYSYIIKRNGGL